MCSVFVSEVNLAVGVAVEKLKKIRPGTEEVPFLHAFLGIREIQPLSGEGEGTASHTSKPHRPPPPPVSWKDLPSSQSRGYPRGHLGNI